MWPTNVKGCVLTLTIGLAGIAGVPGLVLAQGTEAANIIHDRKADRDERKTADYDRGDRFRVYRGDHYFVTNGRGADLLRHAITEGYRQGHAEGTVANQAGERLDWTRSDVYKNGSYGYQDLVDRGQYKYYFREGFELGFQDGYNRRSDYGFNDRGKLKVMVSVVNDLLTVVVD